MTPTQKESSRGGSRGRVQGVHTPTPPPRDDRQFSKTTGIVQKKKLKLVYWCLLVLKWSKRRVHPLLKEILDPPLSRMVDTCTLIWNWDACLYISHCNIKKRKIIPLFTCNGVLRKWNFQLAWQAFYREEGRRSAKGALGEKPSLHNDKKVWVKVCRNQGGLMERL